MSFHVKKSFALLAAVVMTAALGAGCGKKQEAKPGQAKVSIGTDALVSDITSLKVIIDATPGSPAGTAGFPIEATLTKSGTSWTGNITNIPATAAGILRTFTAQAFNGATKVYEGSTQATVTSGQTAQVTIILQEINVTPPPTNYAPVISALTATAAYVLPGQTGSFSVQAYDPDNGTHFNRPAFNGEPLAYQWSATCTNGGTLVLGTPSAAFTTFTAPTVSDSICTVVIKVSETALANNSSVTTYFTLQVNGNFGDADVFAFPNSWPIVTVRGDFRYNFFSDVTTLPVGQQGDLFFSALDPDGDRIRYDLTGKCGTGFDAVDGQLVNSSPLAAAQFSAVTLTAASGTLFAPTFGFPSPVLPYTDPSKSCQFVVAVHDLCTAGNCGPAGSQGSRADGADRGGSTTGYLNATAPSQPRRAPSIVRVTTPNQLGGAITGGQTWDPKKYVVIQPNTVYALTVEGFDQYEAGPLTATWGCNVGSGLGTVVTTPNGAKSIKNELSWRSPAALVADMNCVATVTSTASGLSTVATVRFAGTDPCIGQANGTACDDGNACTTGTTCNAGVCGAPTSTVTCSAASQCQVAGVCDPNTGTCSNPNAPNGTSCNADSNGCTVGDSCNAGACVAGAAPTCNTPPNAFCYAGAGTCASTGNTSFACNYSATVGATCSVANAGTKCNGTSQFTAFACDAGGACVGSGAAACANTTCAAGNVCQAASGACGGGSPTAAGTTCSDGDLCTTGDACNGAGSCVPSGPTCPVGQACNPASGACTAPLVVPQRALALRLSPPAGATVDSTGNTYVTGALTVITPVNFQTRAGGVPAINLQSLGASDAFIAKYDAAGDITWAFAIQDDNAAAITDQFGTLVAVNQAGTVGMVGKFAGTVTFGTTSAGGANPTPIIAAFNGATGGRLWVKGYDLGSNGLFQSVAANPSQASNRFAACGFADAAATQLDPTATFGGVQDLVIGAWDNTGTKLWGRQVGGTGTENCAAVAVDANGDVIATGQFDGATLDLGNGVSLTGPGIGTRKFMWIAKFNGATGAAISGAAFSGTLGNAIPRSLAIEAAGQIAVGGSFSGNLTIGAALTSTGSEDGFIALLTPAFAPSWNAVRIGGTALDLVRSVDFDSFGNVVAVGNFAASSAAFRTANGGADTTGIAGLVSLGGADAMVLKLNGATGATEGATGYGNAGTQSGDTMSVNGLSATNQVTFTVTSGGTVNFGGQTFTAAGASDAAVVFARIQ